MTYWDAERGELMFSESYRGGRARVGVKARPYAEVIRCLQGVARQNNKELRLYGASIDELLGSGGGGSPQVQSTTVAPQVAEFVRSGGDIDKFVDELKKGVSDPEKIEALERYRRELKEMAEKDKERSAKQEEEESKKVQHHAEEWRAEFDKYVQEATGDSWDTSAMFMAATGFDPKQGADSEFLYDVLHVDDSGMTRKNGELDFDSLADVISERVGRDEDGNHKFDKTKLGRQLLDNASEILNNSQTRGDALRMLEKLLANSDSKLTSEDLKKLSENTVAPAWMSALALDSLQAKDKEAMRNSFIQAGNKGEGPRERTRLGGLEGIYKKLVVKGVNAMLPGIESLGGEYATAREKLYKDATEGTDSSLFNLNLGRLYLLKSQFNDKDGEAFKKQFAKEAKELGFGEKWIKEQMASANAISLADLRKNKNFQGITAEQYANTKFLMEQLRKEGPKTDPQNWRKRLIDNFEASRAKKGAPLSRQLSVAHGLLDYNFAFEIAKSSGMKPQDLLKRENFEKVYQQFKTRGTGSKQEVALMEKIRAELKKNPGKDLDYTMFALPYSALLEMDDRRTYEGRNTVNQAGAVAAAAEEQEREAPKVQKPEPEEKKEDGKKTSGGSSGEKVFEDLNLTLSELNEILRAWKAHPPTVKVNLGG